MKYGCSEGAKVGHLKISTAVPLEFMGPKCPSMIDRKTGMKSPHSILQLRSSLPLLRAGLAFFCLDFLLFMESPWARDEVFKTSQESMFSDILWSCVQRSFVFQICSARGASGILLATSLPSESFGDCVHLSMGTRGTNGVISALDEIQASVIARILQCSCSVCHASSVQEKLAAREKALHEAKNFTKAPLAGHPANSASSVGSVKGMSLKGDSTSSLTCLQDPVAASSDVQATKDLGLSHTLP